MDTAQVPNDAALCRAHAQPGCESQLLIVQKCRGNDASQKIEESWEWMGVGHPGISAGRNWRKHSVRFYAIVYFVPKRPAKAKVNQASESHGWRSKWTSAARMKGPSTMAKNVQ